MTSRPILSRRAKLSTSGTKKPIMNVSTVSISSSDDDDFNDTPQRRKSSLSSKQMAGKAAASRKPTATKAPAMDADVSDEDNAAKRRRKSSSTASKPKADKENSGRKQDTTVRHKDVGVETKVAKTNSRKRVQPETTTADDERSAKRSKTESTSNDPSGSTKTFPPKPLTSTKSRMSSRFSGPPPPAWNPAQLLAAQQHLDYPTAQNIVRLFDEDNTIPFVCRYRRELIGDLTPEQMRDIKITYQHILNVRQRADTMLKHLEKDNLCTDEIRSNICAARSLDELDHLYAPYKPASKLALSERARAVGLQEPAEQLLYGEAPVQPLADYVDTEIAGLESLMQIHEGMQHIGAHVISKDARVLDELRALQAKHRLQLTAKLIAPKKETSVSKKAEEKTRAAKGKESAPSKAVVDPQKFETYFDFRQPVAYVRPHQVLAINRGESAKVLAVKVEIPDGLRNDLYRFAQKVFLSDGLRSAEREKFFDKSFEEAYSKKLQPLVRRHVRADLTKRAEAASIEVFATNLKQLLLMSPVKGEPILGIDPGFTNGCKLALISEQSALLATDVIYPHTRRPQAATYGERVAALMRQHHCSLIALGNGTACRETERWLGALMADGVLDAKAVRYAIVSEQGASIYSCGPVAREEFPELDVNLISAASIARRLNDPLGEFVKVEPRHLGVGMYQHDVNEKLLGESLNEVVMECVSFVGVDLNTASAALLRHVAGLTATRAANIVRYREENGAFGTREELRKVKQIGEKTFVQCAGFVRIEPLTAGAKAAKRYERLDSTWVHPESYALARRLVADSGATTDEIGTAAGIAKITALLQRKSVAQLADDSGAAEERVAGVVAALQRELLRDFRVDVDKRPMFKQGLTSMADLRAGTAVSGAVTNQTHFGCFVDIGVEKDGLIHSSQLGGMRPNIGDRVEALVQEVDAKRGRIQLKLVAIC